MFELLKLILGYLFEVGNLQGKQLAVKQNNTHMTSEKRWCCFLNISNMTSKLDKKKTSKSWKEKQLHFDTISSSLRNHPFALLCPSTIYSIKSPSSFSPRCFDQTAFCLFKIRRISPRFRAYKRRPPPRFWDLRSKKPGGAATVKKPTTTGAWNLPIIAVIPIIHHPSRLELLQRWYAWVESRRAGEWFYCINNHL